MPEGQDKSQTPQRPPQFGIAAALGIITAAAVTMGVLRALDVDVYALLVLAGVFGTAIFFGLAVIFLASFSARPRENDDEE